MIAIVSSITYLALKVELSNRTSRSIDSSITYRACTNYVTIIIPLLLGERRERERENLCPHPLDRLISASCQNPKTKTLKIGNT